MFLVFCLSFVFQIQKNSEVIIKSSSVPLGPSPPEFITFRVLSFFSRFLPPRFQVWCSPCVLRRLARCGYAGSPRRWHWGAKHVHNELPWPQRRSPQAAKAQRCRSCDSPIICPAAGSCSAPGKGLSQPWGRGASGLPVSTCGLERGLVLGGGAASGGVHVCSILGSPPPPCRRETSVSCGSILTPAALAIRCVLS